MVLQASTMESDEPAIDVAGVDKPKDSENEDSNSTKPFIVMNVGMYNALL